MGSALQQKASSSSLSSSDDLCSSFSWSSKLSPSPTTSHRMQNKLRRLRYQGGRFVELPPVDEKDFAHLPGLEASLCYHLFLSHAWPLGQDVCKIIKQRCREICPSLH
eukprot:6901136-Prymnesium_polylepis.2